MRRAITGVYSIRNTKNGKQYVGSAACRMSSRWGKHRSSLRQGTHHNSHLQAAWRKYGEDAFEFVVLEECTPEQCTKTEQKWIDRLRSWDSKHGYNLYRNARSPLGLKRPDHVGKAVAEANRRRKFSAEKRRQMSAVMKGRKPTHRCDGEHNGNSKLKVDQVRMIRQLYASGMGPNTLAAKFNVGVTAIQRITRGTGWSHAN